MTTKEALADLRASLRASSNIPEMPDEKVQRIMSRPSATFIRQRKPEKKPGGAPKKQDETNE